MPRTRNSAAKAASAQRRWVPTALPLLLYACTMPCAHAQASYGNISIALLIANENRHTDDLFLVEFTADNSATPVVWQTVGRTYEFYSCALGGAAPCRGGIFLPTSVAGDACPAVMGEASTCAGTQLMLMNCNRTSVLDARPMPAPCARITSVKDNACGNYGIFAAYYVIGGVLIPNRVVSAVYSTVTTICFTLPPPPSPSVTPTATASSTASATASQEASSSATSTVSSTLSPSATVTSSATSSLTGSATTSASPSMTASTAPTNDTIVAMPVSLAQGGTSSGGGSSVTGIVVGAVIGAVCLSLCCIAAALTACKRKARPDVRRLSRAPYNVSFAAQRTRNNPMLISPTPGKENPTAASAAPESAVGVRHARVDTQVKRGVRAAASMQMSLRQVEIVRLRRVIAVKGDAALTSMRCAAPASSPYNWAQAHAVQGGAGVTVTAPAVGAPPPQPLPTMLSRHSRYEWSSKQ